mmetsp:Transcript_11406/g.15559  ORF Transcript_11406/g.15559 Transcript_11406/m.15559 type:complete len:135 (-) Transcript_11406:293-697(-)|eukprot:CAMPEP_0196585066 /NCGR_PEP_ID=MMETSP1081-20130531/49443_1 /TAXON_ID=36882 /ORGANISM="Pyramimonas amylifera, Strain CCMP720" /LENGTH=134 /DNA_ID=CAMNT_0041906497 /DNA_START=172 /DNA_END=576 /DNA_ORIENTATION=-
MEDDQFMMDHHYQYENTYITSPEGYGEGQKFQRGVVQKVIKKIIHDKCLGMHYDPSRASQTGKELSDMIKEKVKTMGFPRYKLVVQVTVGQRAGQCLRIASRCLWDTAADTCASACFENESMFCVAMVFGIYYE